MEVYGDYTNDALASLLTHIVTRYLAKLYAICIIWDVGTPSNFHQTLDTMLKICGNISSSNSPTEPFLDGSSFHLIMTSIGTNTAGEMVNELLASDIENAVNFGCQAFIISTDVTLSVLSAYEAVIYACMHRYPQNHFVFVHSGSNDAAAETMERIFAHSVIADVPNTLLITGNHLDGGINFDLHTSRFVGRTNTSDPVWLDSFGTKNATLPARFERSAQLFPDKLRDLEGRIVRLALFNYKPYSVWEEVPAGQGNANALGSIDEGTLSIDGTESLMLLVFCERHNCTLEISLDEAGEWGEIWDNRSGTGVLGAVAERRADVGISALYEWFHEYQFLDFSTPIARTGITCIVPKPQLLSGLYLPAMPFSWQMWLGVFVSMGIGTLALICVEYILLKINSDPTSASEENVEVGNLVFQMCAMYLFQTSNLMSKPGAEKFILSCVLLIGLMIGNAYSGGLASIMTVPQYEIPIDTPHQMAEHNLEWGATQDAWIFSILLATQPDIAKLVRLFHPTPANELRRRTKSRDFGFSVERLPYGSFAIGEYIDVEAMDYLQLMHNDIYYEYSLAMTSKTWMLKDELDTMIGRVVQSGIQSMWEWQVVVKYSDNNVQLRVATSRGSHAENGPQALSISRMMGAFIIWLIGISVACLSFGVELALKHRVKLIDRIRVA